MEVVAIALALISLIVSTILAICVSNLRRQLASLEERPAAQPAIEPPPPDRTFQGMRIALRVSQDHPHTPFLDLLKEQFLREDVAEIGNLDEFDIIVEGSVQCNGYAEVYYSADLTCATKDGPICTLVERPPHGDRPSNLAIELVAKLRREIVRTSSIEERRAALRELQGR